MATDDVAHGVRAGPMWRVLRPARIAHSMLGSGVCTALTEICPTMHSDNSGACSQSVRPADNKSWSWANTQSYPALNTALQIHLR